MQTSVKKKRFTMQLNLSKISDKIEDGFEMKQMANELRNIDYCISFMIELSNNLKENKSEIERIKEGENKNSFTRFNRSQTIADTTTKNNKILED